MVFPMRVINNRDELMSKLKENGIASSKVHARNDTHSMFKDFHDPNLLGVDRFNQTHLCIPVGWWVTEEQRKSVVEAINQFVV